MLRFSAETFTNSEIEVKVTNISVNIYNLCIGCRPLLMRQIVMEMV